MEIKRKFDAAKREYFNLKERKANGEKIYASEMKKAQDTIFDLGLDMDMNPARHTSKTHVVADYCYHAKHLPMYRRGGAEKRREVVEQVIVWMTILLCDSPDNPFRV